MWHFYGRDLDFLTLFCILTQRKEHEIFNYFRRIANHSQCRIIIKKVTTLNS